MVLPQRLFHPAHTSNLGKIGTIPYTKEYTSKRIIAIPNRTETASYRIPEITKRRDPQFNNKIDI